MLSPDPLTGAILVDLDDDAGDGDVSRVARELDAAIAPFDWPAGPEALGAEISDPANLYRLTPPASEVADVLAALRADPDVEAVEVEREWSIPQSERSVGLDALTATDATTDSTVDSSARGPFRPNDPYYKHQWHLDQIQMPAAWTRTRGRGVIVAVLDTGVLYRSEGRFRQAPDLADTRFVEGFDAISRDGTPDDEHGHGTHVAGTIAQSTNNGIGVAGVAPEAAIMPVRVLDANGSGGWGGLAAGIRWAADHDADVINMSLGGGMPSQVVRKAIEYAHERGVVIVAAAGNASRARVEYPGAYPHVISVGAVRFDETLSFYSSYGRGLDVVAPGGDLRVDQNGDGMPDGVLQNTMLRGRPDQHDYVAWQGTSMATPHVAGAAALLRAAGVRDPDTIERILKESAKSKRDIRRYGSGLIQVDSALAMAENGLGGLRGLAALFVGLLAFAGLRRRGKLGVGVPSALAVAFVLAGGLGLVPFHLAGLGGGEALAAEGLPGVLAELSGGYLAPVVLSALIPFGLAALLLGARRALPVVVGSAVAFSAWMLVEALLPTAHVSLLPAWAVGPWLLVQAGIAAILARVAATRAN